MVATCAWLLCGNGRSNSGCYHGWHMDALWERTDFVWTLSWLAHGCFVGTDGVCRDVIVVGTWMLCGNGRSFSGHYHGWHMDALRERPELVWTLSWLAHGCFAGTDGVCLDVIMVTTWMLCGNGRSLRGRSPWLEHGCSAGTDGVSLGITMVGTWMLCGNGRSWSGRYHGWHMDVLRERTELLWTVSWLAHGCFVGTDGHCLDVYHGWHMDALWERTDFVWTLSWLADGCFVGTDGLCLDVIMVGTWMLCGNGGNGRFGPCMRGPEMPMVRVGYSVWFEG